jgi:hypothetical protein
VACICGCLIWLMHACKCDVMRFKQQQVFLTPSAGQQHITGLDGMYAYWGGVPANLCHAEVILLTLAPLLCVRLCMLSSWQLIGPLLGPVLGGGLAQVRRTRQCAASQCSVVTWFGIIPYYYTHDMTHVQCYNTVSTVITPAADVVMMRRYRQLFGTAVCFWPSCDGLRAIALTLELLLDPCRLLAGAPLSWLCWSSQVRCMPCYSAAAEASVLLSISLR